MNSYDRATAITHIVPVAAGCYALAIGPETAPIVVGEPQALGPAEKRLLTIRRLLGAAIEDAVRAVRAHDAQVGYDLSEDRDAPACCANMASQIAHIIERK